MIVLATAAEIDSTLRDGLLLIAPEAALVGTACVLFVLATFGSSRRLAGVIALAGLGLSALLHRNVDFPAELISTVTPALGDHLAAFTRILALAAGAILVLAGWNEAGDRRACEYHACLLCVIAGLSLVGAANDLIFLFLALELISIPTYVMLYLPRPNDLAAQEAALKYFMLSIMSSALVLFGFSYLYGITGTTNISAIFKVLRVAGSGDMAAPAMVAVVMIAAGLGFRITAFPFHFYAPDVYQAAPLGVVSTLAFVPKAAGFVALLRLFGAYGSLPDLDFALVKQCRMLFWVLAALTMTAGNIMALLQNNFRRLLAYSGVAHSGYMLIGLAVCLAAFNSDDESIATLGGETVLFYLVAYGAMTVGAFAILAWLSGPERRVESIDDLAGLHQTNPGMALLLTFFLFSMIGLPLTAGFFGKFYIFLDALSLPTRPPAGHLYQILAVIGVINAAIAACYYLRVVGVMYLRSSFQPRFQRGPLTLLLAIVVCAIATLVLGVYPGPLFKASLWGLTPN